MCLIVDNNLHTRKLPFIKRLFKSKKLEAFPFVAKNNIKTYKIIRHDSSRGILSTPFHFCNVDFDVNGMFYFEEVKLNPVFNHKKNRFEVNEGLHSYTNYFTSILSSCGIPSLEIHYAIIPSGSEYYIGEENEIVSSQLILFRNKYEMERYLLDNEKTTVSVDEELENQKIK